MFLQRDLFDGDGESEPLARPRTTAGGGGGGAPAGGSYVGGGFPAASPSATGRPMTAGPALGGGGDEGEEVATPGSVTNMRAKMLQQRERLLAKQRSGLSAGGGGMMVTANQSLPPKDTGTTRRPAAPSSPAGNASMSSVPLMGSLDSGHDDDTGRGAVLPVQPPASKEEEEARRRQLASKLQEHGICPEYDPSGSGDMTSSFDIGNVGPSEMRAFLHNPGPKHAGVIQCRICRDRSSISTKLHPKYTMESDAGTFLMTAQKQVKNKTSNYAISMSKTSGKDPDSFLGKLRSDFLGIEWVAFGPGLNPAKADPKTPQAQSMQMVREELVAVQYTASKWGATAKGPRKMGVVIPHVQPNGERLVCRTLNPQAEGLLALQKNPSATQLIDAYQNKPPKWNDQIGAYVLNFNKRVTEASVKNFQLISSNDPETVYLQFGRVDKEVFNLDFRYPISPLQAFAMCLSSFDYKLGCE